MEFTDKICTPDLTPAEFLAHLAVIILEGRKWDGYVVLLLLITLPSGLEISKIETMFQARDPESCNNYEPIVKPLHFSHHYRVSLVQ